MHEYKEGEYQFNPNYVDTEYTQFGKPFVHYVPKGQVAETYDGSPGFPLGKEPGAGYTPLYGNEFRVQDENYDYLKGLLDNYYYVMGIDPNDHKAMSGQKSIVRQFRDSEQSNTLGEVLRSPEFARQYSMNSEERYKAAPPAEQTLSIAPKARFDRNWTRPVDPRRTMAHEMWHLRTAEDTVSDKQGNLRGWNTQYLPVNGPEFKEFLDNVPADQRKNELFGAIYNNPGLQKPAEDRRRLANNLSTIYSDQTLLDSLAKDTNTDYSYATDEIGGFGYGEFFDLLSKPGPHAKAAPAQISQESFQAYSDLFERMHGKRKPNF